MTETTLFIAGFFCFGLTALGVILTMIEFRKGEAAVTPRAKRTEPGEAQYYAGRPVTVLS